MENMTLEALHSIIINEKDSFKVEYAALEIKARVKDAMRTAKKLRKMGFQVDADNIIRTVKAQQKFLAFYNK